MKNIVVIGATGSTGKEVVRLALERSDRVTVVVRTPAKVEPRENLKVLKGDVTDAESLNEAFKNADAVICCFGAANGRKAGNLMSVGTINVVKAAEKNNVPRFVFMSGILQSDGSEFSFFNRLGVKLIRSFYTDVYKDKMIGEKAIQDSKLSWVIVRAVGLAEKPAQGRYLAGKRLKVSPFDSLAYADCALCLLDAVGDQSWTKEIINVGKA